jgi:hypothetical protein
MVRVGSSKALPKSILFCKKKSDRETHPCPPHCPHLAEQLPPEGGEDVGAPPELVVVVVVVVPLPPPPLPPELLLSLPLMKVSAACP